MPTPHTWRPLRASLSNGRPLAAGDIFALDHRAWRVTELRRHPLPADAGPDAGPSYEVRCVPLTVGAPDGESHSMIVHTVMPAPRLGRLNPDPTAKPRWPSFWILAEHYDVCGRCGEPSPCRELTDEKRTTSAVEEFTRYTNPDLCPACSEPITLRQKSRTLPNIISPLGGLVTFHLRARCFNTAEDYEQRALAAGAITALVFSCSGTMTEHVDRSYECTNPFCPSPRARHRGYEACRYTVASACTRPDCSTQPKKA